MKILLCTNNLVGFLSAVYAFFKCNLNADSIMSENIEKSFLNEYIVIEENVENAKAVKKGIIKKGGTTFYAEIADAYLSNNPNKERIILEYLQLFFKSGCGISTMFGNLAVIAFNDMLKKVKNDIYHVSAFIRLMELKNGGYYAYFSADCDVLEKVMPVLIPRFNCMQFAVHDFKRGKIGVYDGKKCEFFLIEGKAFIEISKREEFFQSLWKQYHKNVSISGRDNLRQQRQYLPKKYRHFMHEF